jgi:endonuclease/exonuclease/phosphatase family metal-dependent hydrolase
MTANLRFGEADTSRVVEVAVADDVDVLVLQEVTPRALSGLESAGLGQAFEHRAGASAAGPAGTMVFSRYPLRGVHRLATRFGGYAMELRTPAGRVHLLAVHPRPPLGDVSGWRTDQGVVRHAARATSERTLVVGDLNATMDHVPMRSLVGIGFADAATQANSQWQPTWPASGQVSRFGLSVPSLVAIDHVLLSSGMRALRTESVTVPGTDHRALVAVVAL